MIRKIVPVLLLLPGVTGCALVDHFSSRAASYNDQAETIKEQQFLTNIMRAAYREPLEFSDFTQITGQSSLSGTGAFSIPISAWPSMAVRSYLALPSATASGTQSFTVANLDTQAFYEGILSPIPLTSLDYYLEADYPKALVLTLFVSHISLQSQTANGRDFDFYNSYYGNYSQFEAALQAAIDLGLTTELNPVSQPIGPPMTQAQLPTLRFLTSLGQKDLALKTFSYMPGESNDGLAPDQRADFTRQHVSQYYRLVTLTQKSQFCFAAAPTLSQLTAANQDLGDAGVMKGGRQLADLHVPGVAICGAKITATGDSDPDADKEVELDVSSNGRTIDEKFKIVIKTRSVEGILYYLGEWARAELKIGGQTALVPTVHTNQGENTLFMVRRSCDSSLPDVSTSYFGGDYCMQIDPSGNDRSTEVMEIVSQLFALNNSAQNLPAPNVISVLSP